MKTRSIASRFEKIGIQLPEVLLPAKGTEMGKWAVIACDQYTSQPAYWEDVKKKTGDSPSALHLIFPEVYLEEDGYENRINDIHSMMLRYLNENVLYPLKPGFILVERTLPGKRVRHGLILSVDLEKYDYSKDSKSLVRATEATVVDRIPPRVHIRENAVIELPHIMLLIDDPSKSVIEPLIDLKSSLELLYDFDLMKGGGHIRGWAVNTPSVLEKQLLAFESIADPDVLRKKYPADDDSNLMLFAVGDGNHSLAAAKAHWENLKKMLGPDEILEHPARYALAEVVNIHDEGLSFHPIHRVLFNTEPELVLREFESYYNKYGAGIVLEEADRRQFSAVEKMVSSSHMIPFISNSISGILTVENSPFSIPAGTLQSFLDDFCSKYPDVRIDYIHGEEALEELGTRKGNVGFYLPPMAKDDLFRTVIKEGVLPRKTFSMGEAEEKRYYIECRKIMP